MDAITYTAYALNSAFDYATAVVQFLFHANHHCVTFLIHILSSMHDTATYIATSAWSILRCCILDFIIFLDEFGRTLIFMGQLLSLVLHTSVSFILETVSLCVYKLYTIYSNVHDAVLFIVNFVVYVIDLCNYLVTLVFSAILLLLQGIPNSIILLCQAVSFSIVCIANIVQTVFLGLLCAIHDLRLALISSIFSIPTKAYIGLIILVALYYGKRPVIELLKSLSCMTALLFLFTYIKFIDGVHLFLIKLPCVTFRFLQRTILQRNVQAGPGRHNIDEDMASQTANKSNFLKTLMLCAKKRQIIPLDGDENPEVQILQQELIREKDRRLCIICQDQEKSVTLLPCRHLCLCPSCYEFLRHNVSSCPVCRQGIIDAINVYT